MEPRVSELISKLSSIHPRPGETVDSNHIRTLIPDDFTFDEKVQFCDRSFEETGYTALMWLIMGHVPFILENWMDRIFNVFLMNLSKIQLNTLDSFNRSYATHIALSGYDDEDAIKAMLFFTRDDVLNSADETGKTPLITAITHFKPEVLNQFLSCKKIQVNNPDAAGAIPLHIAVQIGNIDCVRMMLNHPRVDVNACDASGRPVVIDIIYGINKATIMSELSKNTRVTFVNVFPLQKQKLTPEVRTYLETHWPLRPSLQSIPPFTSEAELFALIEACFLKSGLERITSWPTEALIAWHRQERTSPQVLSRVLCAILTITRVFKTYYKYSKDSGPKLDVAIEEMKDANNQILKLMEHLNEYESILPELYLLTSCADECSEYLDAITNDIAYIFH